MWHLKYLARHALGENVLISARKAITLYLVCPLNPFEGLNSLYSIGIDTSEWKTLEKFAFGLTATKSKSYINLV
jgi:hypothetical protein